MAARFENGFCIPAVEVGAVDGAFFGPCEDGDDATEGGSGGEEGEEIKDEAGAGVVG